MEFRYSYLNNEEIINFTKSLLHESGIPDKNADKWFKFIELYNAKQAKFVSSTNSGWVKTNIRKYGDINFNKTLNGWSADEIDSIDINCRISLFLLVSDSLDVNNEILIEVYESELNKVKLLGLNLSNRQISIFRALFMPLDNVEDSELKFSDKFKVLRIYLDSNNDNILEMAHTALIIDKEESLFLLEKKNPGYPFQISEFNSLEDVLKYYNHIYKQEKEIYVNQEKAS